MGRLTVCALLALMLSVAGASAQQQLRFSAFEAPNLTPIARKILVRAYAELGIRIETVVENPQRALLDSASGVTDGELVRVSSVADKYQTLIRVDVPLVVARIFAYTNKQPLRGKALAELKHLRVGHVAGARFASEAAVGFAEIWEADTPEQLFEMLHHDRIDLVIVGEETGRRIIRDAELKGVFPLLPSLREVAFYHLLHERHADLVPRIKAVLRRLMVDPDIDFSTGKKQSRLERRPERPVRPDWQSSLPAFYPTGALEQV